MIDDSLKKANISALFLKPILNIPPHLCFQNKYENTYFFNAEEEVVYNYSIQLLFKPTNLAWFNTFIASEEERGAIIVDEFDYPSGEILLVYRLPEYLNKDFDLILEGKYSKVSENYRKLFPKTIQVKGKEVSSLQAMVINKDKYLKTFWEEEFNTTLLHENEYWGLYDIEKETFKLKKDGVT